MRGQSDARQLRLPSEPQAITTLGCCQIILLGDRGTCVINLPRVALDSGEAGIRTRDLLIASPASQPLGHQATQRWRKSVHQKNIFQNVGPLNLWSPLWPNSLNTPKSGRGFLLEEFFKGTCLGHDDATWSMGPCIAESTGRWLITCNALKSRAKIHM